MQEEYVIYSTMTCSYCKMAENLLRSHKKNIKVIYIDSSPSALQEFKELLPEAKTVPQIFLMSDDRSFMEYIGGYEQLCKRALSS